MVLLNFVLFALLAIEGIGLGQVQAATVLVTASREPSTKLVTTPTATRPTPNFTAAWAKPRLTSHRATENPACARVHYGGG